MKLWIAATLFVSLACTGVSITRPEPFLTKGNKIVYTFYDHRDEDVNIWNHTLFIRNVSSEGGKTKVDAILALIENDKSDTKWNQHFACDSLNFYAYATNWCYVITGKEGVQAQAWGDTLVYPLNMKVGDSLSGATATEKESWHGLKSQSRMDFFRRYVVSVDTLQLPSGKITAFRIATSVRRTSFQSAGKTSDVHEATEWFSPVHGIVKRKYDFGPGSGYTIMTMESGEK